MNDNLKSFLGLGFIFGMAYLALALDSSKATKKSNPYYPDPNKLDEQLESGVIIEEEHKETIERIIEDVRNNNIQDFKVYFGWIAKDHIKEYKDYYTRLIKMEKEALKAKKGR